MSWARWPARFRVHDLRISPLGLVPKKESRNFRMIHHLSFLLRESVNDGISPEEAAVTYMSFNKARRLIEQAGSGALLGKLDIESTFRLFPVNPEYFHLLGCQLHKMGCSISCRYFVMVSSFWNGSSVLMMTLISTSIFSFVS